MGYASNGSCETLLMARTCRPTFLTGWRHCLTPGFHSVDASQTEAPPVPPPIGGVTGGPQVMLVASFKETTLPPPPNSRRAGVPHLAAKMRVGTTVMVGWRTRVEVALQVLRQTRPRTKLATKHCVIILALHVWVPKPASARK